MNTWEWFSFTHRREAGRCFRQCKGEKAKKHKFTLSKEIELQMETNWIFFFYQEEGNPSKLDSDRIFFCHSVTYNSAVKSLKGKESEEADNLEGCVICRQCRVFLWNTYFICPQETGSIGLMSYSEICILNRSTKLGSSKKASCCTLRNTICKSISLCALLFSGILLPA